MTYTDTGNPAVRPASARAATPARGWVLNDPAGDAPENRPLFEHPEACKIDGMHAPEKAPCKTRARKGKPKEIKRERVTGSRIGFPGETETSRSSCTLIPDEELDNLVEAKSVRRLRTMFPREHSAHTAMLARAKSERSTVHPDLRPFKSFLRHLRQCPSSEHITIDRIVNADREYAPGKCRWSTREEQARNRDSSITLPYQGKELPLPEVAELTGQKADTLRHRLHAGWTKEETVAGVRMQGAPLTDAGWPSGVTASNWDGPYKGWSSLFPKHPEATRAVFFCWITGHRIRAQQADLAHRFPEHFSPDAADFDADDSSLPVEDAGYQAYQVLRASFDEAFALLAQDRRQLDLLRTLRKSRRPLTDPKKAYEVMRSRY